MLPLTKEILKILKITISCLAIIIAVCPNVTAEDKKQQTEDKTGDLANHELLLNDAMDKVFSVLETILKDDTIGMEEKKNKAIEFLRVVRYGPENKDYFSIINLQGKVIMDPYIPDLEGKDLYEFEDVNGKRVIQEIIKMTREKGQGYIDYYWPKYEGKTPVAKVTFVRKHPLWPIIIITGVYLDTIDAYQYTYAELYFPLSNDPFIYDLDNASPVTP